jgi:hypothetical protein
MSMSEGEDIMVAPIVIFDVRCPVCGDSLWCNIRPDGPLYVHLRGHSGLGSKCPNIGRTYTATTTVQVTERVTEVKYVIDDSTETEPIPSGSSSS